MFKNNLEKMEKLHASRPSVKITIGLTLRHWLAYKLSDNQEHLREANSITVLKLRENPSHLRLFLLTIFFAIELMHFDKANEMLKIVYKYRSYYKKKQPEDYMRLHFLYALVKARQGDYKSANKHVKFLNDSLMLGIVQLELGQYDDAYSNLARSYAKGCRSIILWTSLLQYYEDAPEANPNMLEDTMSWAISRDADIKGIHYYRLGCLCYQRGQVDEALEYYKKADFNSPLVADKTLWGTVKQLAEPAHEELHSTIAAAAYRLMCKSRYNKNVANVVLKHFNGKQEQWIYLSRALSKISIEDTHLNELILNNAAEMQSFDEYTQKIFIRSAEHIDTQNFIYYLAQNIIIDELNPISEMISVLEKLCINGDGLLAYALCHVYANHNVSANENIVKMAVEAQESENLLFPIFKSAKLGGKIHKNAYIEKYRPFMHKALPGKNVYLYYKFAENEEWNKIRTKHWKFGIYMTQMPHFYNESISYYFSEELPTGSVSTRVNEISNPDVYLTQNSDSFFKINSAIVYEQMFKYDQVEEILGELVKDVRMVRSRLL